MESIDLETKFKEIGKKVAEVSKSAFDKASDKVQDFTDKSILKIDIKKLQSKKDELYKTFGERISKLLCDGTLKEFAIESQEEKEKLISIQNEILDLEKQIQQKQSEL